MVSEVHDPGVRLEMACLDNTVFELRPWWSNKAMSIGKSDEWGRLIWEE